MPHMPRTLQEEIRQSRPFASQAVELLVGLYRTVDLVAAAQRDGLKAFDLSLTQFNVLRILAGAGAAGHRVADIGERLITREPDVTRLVDGLERKGLVRRARTKEDRRVVRVSITAAGSRLVRDASKSVEALAARQFAHLSATEQRTLIELLTAVRNAPSDAS